MTRKEFRAAMLRGLGRCIQAVQQTPEKYRDIVLWACTGNIAYDAQSEGSRAWYVYAMVCSYPDQAPFINAAANALQKYRPKGGWDLLHLTELLMWFAQNGSVSARQAVEEKYQQILTAMFARKRRPNRVFHELSDLEQLGLVLASDSKAFLRIARDFGCLYREKRYMADGDFGWFFASKGDRYRKTMEHAVQKDADIACFLKREQACIAAQESLLEQRKENLQRALTGLRLSRWLAKKADQETVERYAWEYRMQTQPELRAKALEAFSSCPYPEDPQPVIEDACADCEALQNTAWRALSQIRHPAVRTFALENCAAGKRTPENFALLMKNYIPADRDLLEGLLMEMITAKKWDDVHGAGLGIYRAFYKDSGIPHPKHLLPLLYEYNPCSYCRESALVYMSRHRMLTRAILEECLYDSNDDIRRLAARRLKEA